MVDIVLDTVAVIPRTYSKAAMVRVWNFTRDGLNLKFTTQRQKLHEQFLKLSFSFFFFDETEGFYSRC